MGGEPAGVLFWGPWAAGGGAGGWLLGSPLLGTAGTNSWTGDPSTRAPTSLPSSSCRAPSISQRGAEGCFPRLCSSLSVLASVLVQGRPGPLKEGAQITRFCHPLLWFSRPHSTPGTILRAFDFCGKLRFSGDRLLASTWPQMDPISPLTVPGSPPTLGLWLLKGMKPSFSSGTEVFWGFRWFAWEERRLAIERTVAADGEGQGNKSVTRMKSRERGKKPERRGLCGVQREAPEHLRTWSPWSREGHKPWGEALTEAWEGPWGVIPRDRLGPSTGKSWGEPTASTGTLNPDSSPASGQRGLWSTGDGQGLPAG